MPLLGLVIVGNHCSAASSTGLRLAALVALGIAVFGATDRMNAAASRPVLIQRGTFCALISCAGSTMMLAATGSLLQTAGCCCALGGMAAWAATQRRLNSGKS